MALLCCTCGSVDWSYIYDTESGGYAAVCLSINFIFVPFTHTHINISKTQALDEWQMVRRVKLQKLTGELIPSRVTVL